MYANIVNTVHCRNSIENYDLYNMFTDNFMPMSQVRDSRTPQ